MAARTVEQIEEDITRATSLRASCVERSASEVEILKIDDQLQSLSTELALAQSISRV